ncbi:hypothetical protein ACFSQW_12110 [Sphingobacterium tabacisoli]|uniref:Uncharacterized protein n=1 Tax=Sphingobacterium tabacisoli TaxID=2044855 RepID=A0ABW5L5M9_9SPHI
MDTSSAILQTVQLSMVVAATDTKNSGTDNRAITYSSITKG